MLKTLAVLPALSPIAVQSITRTHVSPGFVLGHAFPAAYVK